MAAWLAKSCKRWISSAPKARPVTSPTASTPVIRPPIVRGTASTEPWPDFSTSARVSGANVRRGSVSMLGVETGRPSLTANPASASFCGIRVPGANGLPDPDVATTTRRFGTGSSSHSTDTVPPRSPRTASAMCIPTLSASSDCTSAWPTAESAAASRRAVRSRARTSAWSRSIARRSVRSRKTSTAPTVWPARSRMGSAPPAMARSSPARRASTTPAGSAATRFSRSTRAAGLSAGARVSSCTMPKTVASAPPRASSAVHPVRCSAAAFMNVTRSVRSVTMTASPMLARVTAISSRCARAWSSARRRPAASTLTAPATSTKNRSRTMSSPYGGSDEGQVPDDREGGGQEARAQATVPGHRNHRGQEQEELGPLGQRHRQVGTREREADRHQGGPIRLSRLRRAKNRQVESSRIPLHRVGIILPAQRPGSC